MIKKLLSLAAIATIALGANADTYNLTAAPGWGAAGGLEGISLTCTSAWGQYHLYNATLAISEYKGCEIEYTTSSDQWQFKIEDSAEHYADIDPAKNVCTVSFDGYTADVKYIDLQGKTADAVITITSFSLIKTDDTKVPVSSGSTYWGVNVGAYSLPASFTFSQQYGGLQLLKENGSACTWDPSSNVKQVYTVVLSEPAPFEMNMEADNASGSGIHWSYPNLNAGETSFTFTLPTVEGETSKPTEAVGSIYLKCAAANPTNDAVKIKSITLEETPLGQTGIADITVEDENAPIEYFNLQGVRVENPENGLYIRRQGNKVTKIVL